MAHKIKSSLGISLTVVLLLLSVNQIHGIDANSFQDSFSLGMALGSGYSWGHIQESIYSSDPLDGWEIGGGIWMMVLPLRYGPAAAGLRFEIEYRAVPVNWAFVSLLNAHADIIGEVKVAGILSIQGFGGVSIAGTTLKYPNSDVKVSEEGYGFRYGGGVLVEIYRTDGLAISIGPDLAIHHFIYEYSIYHFSRVSIKLEAELK